MENTKTYLGNSFALQMLDLTKVQHVTVTPVTADEVSKTDFVSVIGHVDTAAVVSNLLGKDVPANRASISIGEGDVLYVAQLVGVRLPEGATSLPEGFKLTFVRVTID